MKVSCFIPNYKTRRPRGEAVEGVPEVAAHPNGADHPTLQRASQRVMLVMVLSLGLLCSHATEPATEGECNGQHIALHCTLSEEMEDV